MPSDLHFMDAVLLIPAALTAELYDTHAAQQSRLTDAGLTSQRYISTESERIYCLVSLKHETQCQPVAYCSVNSSADIRTLPRLTLCYIYIYSPPPMARQPLGVLGRLSIEASRSHFRHTTLGRTPLDE